MSTSFTNHAMGAQGYGYVHQKFEGGSVIFWVRPKWRLVCCPVCKSKQATRRGLHFRKLRSVPVGRKSIWLSIEVPRVWCAACNCVRRIRLAIAEPRRSYTRAFARHVLELTKVMTLKDVALFLGIGWEMRFKTEAAFPESSTIKE